jgi:hypothetical protein
MQWNISNNKHLNVVMGDWNFLVVGNGGGKQVIVHFEL